MGEMIQYTGLGIPVTIFFVGVGGTYLYLTVSFLLFLSDCLLLWQHTDLIQSVGPA